MDRNRTGLYAWPPFPLVITCLECEHVGYTNDWTVPDHNCEEQS